MEEHGKSKEGRFHIYAGDGKGKTTASVGLSIRAAGRGWRVLFVQFLKSGNSGELTMMEKIQDQGLGQIKLVTGQKINKFTFRQTPEELAITKEACQERLEEALRAAKAGECDLLVLDEALGAIHAGVLDEKILTDFIAANRPLTFELVVTGRDPSPALIELADYYSEVCARKHPYETIQLNARPGVEF